VSFRQHLEDERNLSSYLIKSSRDMIIAVDQNRIIQEFNPESETALGYSRSEMIGQHADILYMDAAEGRLLSEQSQTRPEYISQINFRRKDGSYLPVRVNTSHLLNEQGTRIGTMAIARDITEELIRTETNMAQRVDMELIHALNDLYKRSEDIQEPIALFNRELSRAFQARSSLLFLVNGTHLDLVDLHLTDALRSSLEPLFMNGTMHISLDISESVIYRDLLDERKTRLVESTEELRQQALELSNGAHERIKQSIDLAGLIDRFYAKTDIGRIMMIPILDLDRSLGILQISREQSFTPMDISRLERLTSELGSILKHHESSQALKASERRFRDLYEFAPIAYLIADSEGILIDGNQMTEIMSGYSLSELVGRSLEDLGLMVTNHDPKVRALLGQASQAVATGPDRFRLTRKDGRSITVEVSTHPMQRDAGNYMLVIARDVTDQEEAQIILQESEEKFRNVTESTADAIISASSSGRIISWNKAAEDLFHYSKGEIIGESVTRIIPSDLKATHHQAIERFLQTGKTRLKGRSVELEGVRKDGVRIPLELSFSTWNMSNERFFTAILRDVTARRRAEKDRADALRSARERSEELKALLETSRLILEMNSFRDVSQKIFKSACAVIGATNGYVALLSPDGKSNDLIFLDLGTASSRVLPNTPMPIRGLRGEAYRTGKTVVENDLQKSAWAGFIPEGHVQLENVMFAPLKIQNRTVGIMGIGNKPGGFDDNDARIAEAFGQLAALALHNSRNREALVRSEEKYRLIVENANDGIEISQDNHIIFANQRFAEMLGYSVDELSGITFDRIYSAACTEQMLLRSERRDRGEEVEQEYEARFRRKDETLIDVLVKYEITEYLGKPATFAIIRDITQQKLAEMELQHALERAKEGERVKSAFMTNVSHEIRTPLNSILGFSELLERNLKDKVSENEKEFFHHIRRNSERLVRTVDEVLTISQLEAAPVKLAPTELRMIPLLTALAADHTRAAEAKQLRLRTQFETESDMVLADEFCVTNALSNLIDNAIKYTKRGSIDLILSRENDVLKVKVKDTGIGMSPEYQQRMFTPFSQESEGFTRNYQGIGLGLALVKRYMDLNHITMQIESEQGVGTTFTLVFPTMEALR